MWKQSFSVGDIVEHRILRTEKVIIGIEKKRYLCVDQKSIDSAGCLKPRARVASHSNEHLIRVGRYGDIVFVRPERLYDNARTSRIKVRGKSPFKRSKMITLGIAAVTPVIAIALLSGLASIRTRMETDGSSASRQGSNGKGSKSDGRLGKNGDPGIKSAEEYLARQGDQSTKEDAVAAELQREFAFPELSGEDIDLFQQRFMKAGLSGVNIQEVKQLAQKYKSGNLSAADKERLKQQYLKSGISESELQRLKEQYKDYIDAGGDAVE